MAQILRLTAFGLAALIGLNNDAAAQVQTAEPTRQDIALAAGYKAMFTCSAVFNGGKTSEQIAGDELSNYYKDYIVPMAEIGTTEINHAEQYVSSSFADDMPPRIAA